MPAYILTGTPGSGKTAILRMLETVGYLVVEEAATDVIALGHALSRDTPWEESGFIDKIVALQWQRQDHALAGRNGGIVFFIRNHGFVQATPARRISFADSLVFERIHEQTYRDLGFHLIDIPPGPLPDRVALIEQAVRVSP